MDHLLKTNKEFKNLKEQEIQDIFIKHKLGKACFQQDMPFGDFKDLLIRTAAYKVLCNKAFNIAKNSKYDGYQRDLTSVI